MPRFKNIIESKPMTAKRTAKDRTSLKGLGRRLADGSINKPNLFNYGTLRCHMMTTGKPLSAMLMHERERSLCG